VLVLQLSTKLHSTHRSIDVLDRAYRSARILYPSFDYCFLMSQEFQSEGLPIKLIEYTQEQDPSPGIRSFINNSIEKVDAEGKEASSAVGTDIFAPLAGEQGVYGVLQILIPEQVQVTDKDLEFIKQFTNIVGRAIERTTLYQSSNQLVTDLQI